MCLIHSHIHTQTQVLQIQHTLKCDRYFCITSIHRVQHIPTNDILTLRLLLIASAPRASPWQCLGMKNRQQHVSSAKPVVLLHISECLLSAVIQIVAECGH